MLTAEIHTGKGVMKVTFYEDTIHLDRHHTCFGKVYEGVEVVDKIRQGDEIEKILISEE